MDNKHYKMYQQIGLNILYFRKERGLTQLQLAELANYSRNHIQQIETAATVPSLDALLDIAAALGIEPERLFHKK